MNFINQKISEKENVRNLIHRLRKMSCGPRPSPGMTIRESFKSGVEFELKVDKRHGFGRY